MRRSRSCATWQRQLAAGRWVGVAWPEAYGGRGAGPGRALHRHRGAGPRPRARAGRPHRDQPGRADAARARHAEISRQRWLRRILPAEELWCQLFSEPERGQRPGVAHAPGRAPGRRRVGAERPEGVDELRAVRRLGLVPGPHRPGRPEAAPASPRSRSTCAPRASRCARCARSPDETEFNEVFFSRRVRARRPADRPAERGLAGRELHSDPRARHQPPPARDPPAARRRAAAPGRSSRGLRTTTACAHGSPRPPSRCALFQLAQLAQRCPGWRTAGGSGPEGGA